MKKRILIGLMAVVIVLQSLVAIADAHQYHQSGSGHLAFAPVHSANETPVHVDSHDRSYDCHHCCHCHGHSHSLPPAHLAGYLPALPERWSAEHGSSYVSTPRTSRYRPPIA